MPIYEYRCSSCGFQKEYLRKVSDPLLSVCPECSNETFGKMLTAAGFQLKGGGWYVTDFKNSGARPAAKNDGQSETAAKAESKSETAAKAESKSETLSESKNGGKSEGKSEDKSHSKTEAQPAAPAATASAAKAE